MAHLDCRDCKYFSSIHKSSYYEGKFKCDECGKYFDDYYGMDYPENNCSRYVSEEDEREYKRQAQEKEKRIADYWLAATILENSDEEESAPSHAKCNEVENYNPVTAKLAWGAMNVLYGLFVAIMIIGSVVATVLGFMDHKHKDLESRINKYVYDEAWKTKGDDKTLFFMMNIDTIPVLFDKDAVRGIYREKLNFHNKRVDDRKRKRNSGWVVKPKDILYDHKIQAYFTNDIYIDNSSKNRVILISDNINSPLSKEIKQKCEAIKLDY